MVAIVGLWLFLVATKVTLHQSFEVATLESLGVD